MDFISLFEKMIYFVSTMGLSMKLYAIVLSAVGIYLILFILQGIGLYGMAEKQSASHKWQAFVPFANTFLIGRLAGDCPFCGKKIKKIQIWLVVSEVLAFLTGASWLVFEVLATFTDVFAEVQYVTTEVIYGVEIQSIHFTNNGLEVFNNIMPYFSQLFDLVFFVLFIIALVNLFRKYSARNGMSITMWCIIAEIFFGVPIHGIFIFAMRNNKAVDYNEYVRRKQAEYIRQQQEYRNAHSNPYDYYARRDGNQNNSSSYNYDPYTGQPLHRNKTSSEQPFSEFGSNSEKSDDDENGPFSL